jgi:aminocarboxymuconate-semialdehyde decarboxylase
MLVLDFGDGYVERVSESCSDPGHLFEALELAGIDIAILSINQPGVLYMPSDEAGAIARDANDELLALVQESNGRLEGLATLPWQVPELAIAELERTASLGLRGAMACSNVAGQSLDALHFDPVFEAAERLRMPMLLHPSLPLGVQTLGPYGLTCAAGFLMDTTTAVLRVILGGTFDRHPGLKLILAHAGSLLPQIAGRLDLEYDRGTVMLSLADGRHPTDYIGMLYTDTVAGSPSALQAAVGLFSHDRVLLGSDYPFWDHELALRIVRQADLGEDLTSRITGLNAIELFALNPRQRANKPTR